jgi:phage protein D
MPAAVGAERRQNKADFRLTLDGQDLTDKVRPRLVSLRLTEKRGGEADELELVLDDSDGKLAIPRDGVLIRLSLGWASGSDIVAGLVDKGRFTVDDAEWSGPPDQVTIRARSADLTSAFRSRREGSWRDTTLGAVAADVAGRHGLTAKVAPALQAVPVKILAADQRSDMAVLRRLGREHDAIATVKDRTLILAPIGAGTTAGGKPIPAAAIARADGDRATWKRISRDKYQKVEARWHDQDGAARKTASAPIAGATAGGTRRLSRTYHSQADAEAAAKAEAGRIARKAASLSLSLALGRPDLYPDRAVSVSGFKAEINAGKWLIADATHSLDGQGGLTTALTLETA